MAAATRPPTSSRTQRPISIEKSSHIPGYGGFCPTIKYASGSTYSKATARYFDVARSDSLNTTTIPPKRRSSISGDGTREGFIHTMNIPTSPQSRPTSAAVVTGKWSSSLPYSLSHTGARRDEIMGFEKSIQEHRVHYKDHTGLIPRVHQFSHVRRHSEPAISVARNYKFNSEGIKKVMTFTLPNSNPSKDLSTKWQLHRPLTRRTSTRERATRDQHFERR